MQPARRNQKLLFRRVTITCLALAIELGIFNAASTAWRYWMSDRATPLFEEGTLPQRLKPIFAVIDWNFLGVAWQAALAAVGASFLGLNSAQQWMFWAIVFDLVSGFLCGLFVRGGLRARIMGRGLMVKFFCFAVVAYLCRQPGLEVAIAGASVHVGSAAAIWYTVYEWVSTAENLDELGAPIPPFLRKLLAKARETVDQIGESPKGKG
jgi:phage-related holin